MKDALMKNPSRKIPSITPEEKENRVQFIAGRASRKEFRVQLGSEDFHNAKSENYEAR